MPLGFAVFCYGWWRCLPVYPGYSLAALALLGIILAIRVEESQPGEQLIWVLVGAVLLATEIRVAHEASVNAKSYLFCQLYQNGALVELQGTAIVRSASMHVLNQDALNAFKESQSRDGGQYSRLFQNIPVGDFAAGQHKSFCLQPIQTVRNPARYRVRFDAENGSWWEDIQIRLVHGRQIQALRVLRYRGLAPEVLFEQDDPAFPRGLGGRVDWSWATPDF